MDFTNKDDVPVDEAREMMGEIGGRGMGYLFETWRKWTFRLKDEIHREKENEQKRLKSGQKRPN